jgi:hypothetical protein
LAIALGQDPPHIEQTLVTLAQQGLINLLADGQAEVELGRTRRRTLPARLWPALHATHRLYSTQEIATLRTVTPILQFARAKLGEFADHGPGHALRVKSFATQLGYLLGLTLPEQHLLRAAALFHDIGNIVDRQRHHLISQETVEKLTAAGQLPFSAGEAALIGLVCRWHRKEYEPERCDRLQDKPIRTGLLASILRVADAMDIDFRRADYSEQFTRIVHLFFPREIPYWTSLEEILGLRLLGQAEMSFQVFTRGPVSDNIQIAMLRQDLAHTPLAGSVQQIAVIESAPPQPAHSIGPAPQLRPALLAFSFDPHSLVMAALSRKHLQATGYAVQLLAFPNTPATPGWLWGDKLAQLNPANFARVVVIGDRPDPTINQQLFSTVARWRAHGLSITSLNRHEANWSRTPALLEQGVEVTLGGDWAYFWGDQVTFADFLWGRVAALCTRDSTQATTKLVAEEQLLSQGLLKVVYEAVAQASGQDENWIRLAEPILEHIAGDDRAYFTAQAHSFAAAYATLANPGQVKGKLLLVELEADQVGPSCYWALEQAIEQHGRLPERGLCYQVPYALATWPQGEVVGLLAMNHWRDEAAIPIRLLYPGHLGPAPEGNECTLQAYLTPEQAQQVIQALIAACNQA